jgi:ABC-type dipeptide/oligopeptide/nickel transport system ATPase component
MIKWKQGEHVVIVGDTGSGKTYLEAKLLALREHVIVVRTKPDDIKFPGFHKVNKLSGLSSIRYNKFLFVPKYEEQQTQCAQVMDLVWREGGWCIALDETYYQTEILRLSRIINKLFTQGRSKHITVVAGMQRPAWISRFTLSQATHAFIFRMEGRDLTTLSQALSPTVVKPVMELTGHDLVYYNRATRDVITSNANKIGEFFSG